MRLVALALALLVAVVGCSRPAPAPDKAQKEDVGGAPGQVSVPADVPDYKLTKDEVASDPALGLRIRGVSVSTDGASAESLEAITRELWSETRDAEALIAAFYPDKPRAALSGTGYAFEDREAARAVLSSQYTDPSEAKTGQRVEKAMANGGISVRSMQE